MKLNKTFLIITLSTIVITVVIAGILLFNDEENENIVVESVMLFNNKSKELVRVEYEVDYSKEQYKIIEEAFEFLSKNVEDSNISRTIPENIELVNFYIDENDTLFLNLNNEYYSLSIVEQNILRSSLSWSMSSLDFVKQVGIHIDYNPIILDNDGKILLSDKSNTIINPQFSYTKGTLKTIAIYFPKKKSEGKLYTEIREIVIGSEVLEERMVLNELLKGPTLEEGLNAIPSSTKIREIITFDKTCQIDLSSEFITNNSKVPAEQIASVYAIVNSLTDIKYIDKVQFLIDSKKTNGFDSIDISQPLEKDISYIE